MGLRKDVSILGGDIEVKDAYFRIKSTVIEWDAGFARIILGGWVSREASKADKQELPLGSLEVLVRLNKEFEGYKSMLYQAVKQAGGFFSDTEDVIEGDDDAAK